MGKAKSEISLPKGIQVILLSMLCFDDSPKGANLVRTLVPAKSYGPYYTTVATDVETYLDQYKKPPGIEHTADIIEAIVLRRPDQKEQYEKLYNDLLATKDEAVNREYVLEKATAFSEIQHYRGVVAKLITAANTVDGSSLEEIKTLFAKANAFTKTAVKPGILFNDPSQALAFLTDEAAESFPTGIKELDRLKIGPARGEYLLIAAETNVGKSWSGTHLGKVGLMSGHKVCHVTLEMNKNKVARRYVQAFFSIGKRDAMMVVSHFKNDAMGRVCEMLKEKEKRPTFEDKDVGKLLRRKMEPLKRKPPLYIVDFPSGSLTVRALKTHLDYLEATEGLMFDMLIVDYPDLMQHNPQYKRAELEKIAVDLRGLGAERNLAVVGFTQVNEAKTGKIIKTGRSHEGRAKEHTADCIWTLNQTEQEYEFGLMRLNVAKGRDTEKNVKVLLSQNLGFGQFAIDSTLMQERTYESLLNGHSEGSDDDGKD